MDEGRLDEIDKRLDAIREDLRAHITACRTFQVLIAIVSVLIAFMVENGR